MQAALQDARFVGLVSNPDFALDPTDPRFRQAEGAAALAAAVAKRKSGAGAALPAAAPAPNGQAAPAINPGVDADIHLTLLLRSLNGVWLDC
jgi:hypothetical protein